MHDYHLIPLADELRALGVRNRIGFFLHIPLPPPQILAAIPAHEWLMRALFAYDLVGLQSDSDLQHFERFVLDEAQAEALPDGHFRAFGRIVRAGAFPIGIDVDEFTRLAGEDDAREMYKHDARAVLEAQAAGRRRPARLLQGPAAAHAHAAHAARALSRAPQAPRR